MNSNKNNIQNSAPERLEHTVSQAVIKRLPRYFRYLRELLRQGKMRISSGELSAMMNVTASQIRQDLNCFGGFGQQGYGYNVNYLYAKISEILGVGAGLCAVVIGIGDLGRALVRTTMFEKRGVDIIGLFDVDPALIGKSMNGLTVRHVDTLERFCEQNHVDFAVLTVPKSAAEEITDRLSDCGVRGLWNFTGVELQLKDDAKRPPMVENVHLGDSLMTLTYQLCADQNTDDASEV
ncbi:MAG: redox-sensing transcriptional repressor Rex [Clostridia bacterium]|nr:redox-sensing transcriptional repressor Rex [Clostridia bacterium]